MILIIRCPFFIMLGNGQRYVFVADYEALSCQVTQKFIRSRNAETPTISAIKYTACYQLGVFINCNSAFHFCYNPNLLFDIVVYRLSASDARLKAKNASFNGCETELVGSDKTID